VELATLNRKFLKQDVIDAFTSVIWTERYYGDSEVELVVPATAEMVKKLSVGTFLSFAKSDEVMILETADIEDNQLKVSGISLLPWLDNRFIRSSDKHEELHFKVGPGTAGFLLWAIIYFMCVEGSPFLDGSTPTGIPNPQQLAIPGLGLKDYDKSGRNDLTAAVPYGPVYKAMHEIATAYEIGMTLTLETVTDTSYSLRYRNYKGLDRTSGQSQHPPVRFSPHMDSLTDIKEFRSLTPFKTQVYTFAPELDPALGLTTAPGIAKLSGSQYVGFDLRALMTFASDITTDTLGGSQEALVDILNMKAVQELANSEFIKIVDGEIVPTNQFKYGVHYNLGDIIEVQGNSEIVTKSRVVEYIYAQDESGERAYPTVALID
jgi:hypothetical protein